MPKISFSGLKSRGQQSTAPSGGSRGGSVSLSFLAAGSHMHFLAQTPSSRDSNLWVPQSHLLLPLL